MKQLNLLEESKKRDAALDLFEAHRAVLVEAARIVARSIARKQGRVTSPEVTQEMRRLGFGHAIDSVDKRFMGAVFRDANGWRRLGFENLGSHRQPISVWAIAEESA